MKITLDKILLFAVLVYLTVAAYAIVSGFQQLPSPIFGGDLYYQLGSMTHAYHGGNPLASPNILGSEPGYAPMYGMFAAYFAKLIGAEPLRGMLLFTAILAPLAFFLAYLAFSRIMKSRILGLIGALLYLPFNEALILKYTPFAGYIIAPLFFFSFYSFYEKRTWPWAAMTGILYGLSAIAHGVAFIAFTILIFIFIFYDLVWRHFDLKSKAFDRQAFSKEFREKLKYIGIILVIGVLLAQLYWFKPIFVYHGKTPNEYVSWNSQDLSELSNQVSYLYDFIKGTFFNFSSLFFIIKSLLTLAGLAIIFLSKNRPGYVVFSLILLTASAVGGFHYFVTQPVLGTNLVPGHIIFFLFAFTSVLLVLMAIKTLTVMWPRYKNFVLGFMIAVLLLQLVLSSMNYGKRDQWIQQAKSPLPENLKAAAGYMLANSQLNDVFLSTNELSFAMNALTGRKEVVSRRAHNSPFLDMDRRQADAAVMLYGNNSALRKELLKKYGVKYLYWDAYWIQSEFQFDQSGQIVGAYDPLLIIDSKKYSGYLKENGVKFVEQYTWVDPALRGEGYKKFNVLIVLPYNFTAKPWNPDLNKHLESVWRGTQNNQVLSEIYLVKAD